MERLIDVRHGSVWAEDSGGDLPPVVLLHPGTGDSRIWDPVRARLAGRYRLIRYDVRGFGRSAPPAGRFSPLDDLRRVLDRLGVGPALFAGCSMGGGAALDLALAEPDRARGMVLACPGISGAPPAHDPDDEPDSPDPAVFLEQGLARWARAGRDPLVVDLLRGAVRFWLHWGDSLADDGDAWSRLEEVAVPTALLLGDLERPSFVPACVTAARRIPGCRFVEVPGADHFLPLRAPGAVVEALDSLAR
ncbi:pimeloyl-ACP methyl ester carboxylesterase [Actinoplanes octamycinicus]|uniref:Pimeloyl-ACP methyl ester carboxylesterase n=1 Tax=Actinoplanes octamycinicus TaxID=135948 RepID=A0A7W7H3S0_9ACTN|nr:alpha/beta fold hydrolase [Actinoplanes octamycinicus]MBB4743264.1 pimeloyl-ACP methyl ester carboxylesterase [Actinoplanes octamycinicus]GIE63851.1 hydrolase [Actinoplanes octamycinicus]